MGGIEELIQGAGWSAYLVIMLGVIGLGNGVAGVVGLGGSKVTKQGRPAKSPGKFGLAAMGCVAAMCGAAAIGYWYGMSHVEAALAFAAPDQKQLLYEHGRQEALGNFTLAMYAGPLPFLLGLIAFVGGRSRQPGPDQDFQPPSYG